MNGIRSKALMLGCLAVLAGCQNYASYNDLVDPCYPQRYMCTAREEVNKPFGTQASNGLALDQTVWNYHFVEGTDKLNAMGMGHLDRLARRRPGPIPELFVQTAQDVRYDPAKPEASVQARTELDQKRQKAVTDYLSAVRSDVPFTVAMHNPSPVGMSASEASLATQGQLSGAVGTLNAATTATASAVRSGTQPTQNITTNVSR